MITTYCVDNVQLVAVQGHTSLYVIEPYRHRVGVSRAAMVDQHLAELRHYAGPRHPDLPVLEAARTRFRADDRLRGAA